MERILGLLDTLESMICDSTKIPFTGKTIINESAILQIIDKIRLVGQSDDKSLPRNFRREQESQQVIRTPEKIDLSQTPPSNEDSEAKAIQLIQQAYQVAKEIRGGADNYADEVLSNLEATTTRILRAVKNGRLRLSKQTVEEVSEPAQNVLAGHN
ncbi:MAG: hypothetical protein WC527_07320 [Candidatus Margulisiibacteriota bacterium]